MKRNGLIQGMKTFHETLRMHMRDSIRNTVENCHRKKLNVWLNMKCMVRPSQACRKVDVELHIKPTGLPNIWANQNDSPIFFSEFFFWDSR